MKLKSYFLFMALLLLWIPMTVQAKFKCDAEMKDYAKEMVQLELAGARAPQKSSCLNQNQFKYVRVSHDPINELINQKFYYAKPSSLVIDNVKKIHKDKRHYRVDFSVQAGESLDSLSTQKGSLIFFHNPDPKWGCAHLLFPPEDIFVSSNCQ